MNNETKEMYDEIKEMTKVLKSLGNKQASELYYYITNLEEELEEEKRINQEDLKYIDELNERIEKAIEYIEHNTFQDSDGGWIFTFYKGKEILLDILRGEDK